MQVSQWKKELQERMSELFERKNARDPDAENEQRRIAQLERTVGRPIDEAWVERDWLQKKSKELGID